MPSSHTPQHLGALLQELIERRGYRDKIDAARAVEAWAHLAGPQINALTDRVWVNGGRLFVKVRSAPWRHQLHLQREAWRARLNEDLGREVVREIVFR